MLQHSRDERGQAYVLTLAIVAAFLMAAGLVLDGGRQVTSTQRAQTAADAATRAAVNAAATGQIAGRGPNVGAATRAANQQFAGAGVTGTVTVSAGRVSVRTTATSPTLFLSIIGVSQVRGTAESSALLTTPDQGGRP